MNSSKSLPKLYVGDEWLRLERLARFELVELFRPVRASNFAIAGGAGANSIQNRKSEIANCHPRHRTIRDASTLAQSRQRFRISNLNDSFEVDHELKAHRKSLKYCSPQDKRRKADQKTEG
jgi:hypothetical protein